MIRRRRPIAVILAGTFLLAVGASLIPRTRYLLDRAEFHASMERAYSAQAEELRLRLVNQPDAEFLPYELEDVTEKREEHGRLNRDYRRAAFRPWESGSSNLPLPYPWDKARDRAVLQAALRHWLAGTPPDNSDRDHEGQVGRIILDDVASIEPFDQWDLRERVAQQGFPSEIVDDLERRNPRAGEQIGSLGGSDLDVVFHDLQLPLTDAREQFPTGSVLAKATLPGYSRDGSLALVGICNVADQHSPGAAYVLVRVGKQWMAKWSYVHVEH